MNSPAVRNLAQSLFAYEAATAKLSDPTEAVVFRVCEKLRPPLCTLAGVAGFRSLLSRALALARAEGANLSAVRVGTDGSLQGLDELRRQLDKDEVRQGEVTLIAQLLGLLLTFIGKGLAMRLVKDVWPEFAFDDRDSVKEEES